MTILGTMTRGMRASITGNNIMVGNGVLPLTRFGAGAIPLVNGKSMTYEQLYIAQPWVRTAVNKIANGIARLPLDVYQRASEGEGRERLRDGWLAQLLANPVPGYSPYWFKASVAGNVAIHGNCIAVKVRNGPGMPPVQLIPSSFASWRAVAGKSRPVDWWVFYPADGKPIPFRPEEVVHFGFWSSGTSGVCSSPMEALRTTLLVEDAAQRTQAASYQNGARPSGVFTTSNALPDADAVSRMRAEAESLYGGVDNAFRIAVMYGGLKWEPMSHSLVDSEIIATRKLTREEVAAVYDIPPPTIGILDQATYSNIDTQHRMFYQDSLGTWTVMIEEALGTQLIASEPLMAGQFVEFNMNEVLKGDTEARMAAYNAAQWWLTPNEVRQRENLPQLTDDPEADRIHIEMNRGGASGTAPSGE